ncbi:hypothetical protein FQN49_006926 [Arthroderma sp. PD_2]|nr:hypothetical protein FQN49_006926 [Arthroderma sp. PD_2]
MCRAILKIIDGEADAADFKDGKVVRSVGRPYEGLIGSRSGNTKFESAGKHSSMVSTALGGEAPYHNSNATPMETPALDTGADDSGEDEEGSGKNGMLSDSDDDLIIRPKPKRRRQL